MTYRERERLTLDFGCPDRGAVEETFYPWVLTCQRFKDEGMPAEIALGAHDITNDLVGKNANADPEKYLPVTWGEGVMAYENYFGFDPVRRIHFVLPFRRFEEYVVEETPEHVIRQDIFGRWNIQKRGSAIELPYRPIVADAAAWQKMKQHADAELAQYFTDAAIDAAYGPLKAAHDRGDYTIRLNLEGFFWTPRELLGIEPHLYAFYDQPELIEDMCEYMLNVYLTYLPRVLDLVQPDVVYLMEDLSGRNGPMVSNRMIDRFVGAYYRRLIPMLRAHGVGNVFVDTDGDFMKAIPVFLDAGVDGFLPMDVNAGMDIVKVRQQFPKLKIIGGYNKLEIEKGPAAIDAEFARILPVVRQGGYIVGADHQVPPSASLENYKYYIARLREVMAQCGQA
ncbi:MAG: hypothetical protein MJ249_02130 [Kiritimatiellae bacterium]|nr:hypothetical protein [Kiritimatiellia bacterium]